MSNWRLAGKPQQSYFQQPKKIQRTKPFQGCTLFVNVDSRRLIVEILSSFKPVLKISGMKSANNFEMENVMHFKMNAISQRLLW